MATYIKGEYQSKTHCYQPFNTSDRIKYILPHQTFIAFKDYKANFTRNPKCKLINPTKTVTVIISKSISDSILNKLCRELYLQIWDNSESVTDWFKDIKHKSNRKFTMFDIVDSSVSRPLFF